ncbi:hypothetical protein [Gordonia araii]|nr:hypothetical protein [Gordonia araii]NNG97549.1 hypothetical protein [Gordonia araii NBRC 100433]
MFALLGVIVLIVAALFVVLRSEPRAESSQVPRGSSTLAQSTRASNTIAVDRSLMLTASDLLPGAYISTPLTDPYVPIDQELKGEQAKPSSPEGCHELRLDALTGLSKVPLSAMLFQPYGAAGSGVQYTQMVVHDSNAVARQVTSTETCADRWLTDSRGRNTARRVTPLPEPSSMPDSARVFLWHTWQDDAGSVERRIDGYALVGNMGMHLFATSSGEIEIKEFESVFRKAVNRFAEASSGR